METPPDGHGFAIGGLIPAEGVVFVDSGCRMYVLLRDEWEALVAEARETLRREREQEGRDGDA